MSGDRLQLGSSAVRFEIQDSVDRAYGDAISRLLNVDELSGLYAPRRFKAELKLRLDRARIRGEPLALLVMDLDGVKAVNDRWGHAFGAHAIAETGRVIAARLDGKGFVCRWGGDEFVAALPEYSGDSAEAIGDEIRRNVHGRRLQLEGVELSVEISIGVAEFPAQARDAKSLFRAADQALYRAKRAGKNRVSR